MENITYEFTERYLNSKQRNIISKIYRELDFDNKSNRNVNRYYVTLKDGTEFSTISVAVTLKRIKSYCK